MTGVFRIGGLSHPSGGTTLDPGRLVREMDATTREGYLETYRSLWSGQGFLCDLEHESRSDEPIDQPALIKAGHE